MKSLILLLFGIVLSYFCRKLPIPFLGFFLLWSFIFSYISISSRRPYFKVLSGVLTVFFLVAGVSEFYFWKGQADTKKTTSKVSKVDSNTATNPFRIRIEGKRLDHVPHNIFGYSPRPNSKRRVTAYLNDSVLYDITYTIDENGMRITPKPKNDDSFSILFFGDSFTHGESVSDDETLPYVTSSITDREIATYNFGISGQGPQVMLAQIESGFVDRVVKHSPKFAIYWFINDNIIRLKGLRGWLVNGPQYVMNSNGDIVLSPFRKFLLRINTKMKRSYVYNELYKRIGKVKVVSDSQFTTGYEATGKLTWGEGEDRIDIKLIKTFAAVIDKSRMLLESKYPGIQFHVIYWDEDQSLAEVVTEEIQKRGLVIHKASDILPGSFTYDNRNPYRVKFDGHPTPLTHRLLADYIIKNIVNYDGTLTQ